MITMKIKKKNISKGFPHENYFTSTFEVLSNQKQIQLEQVYIANQGRLPNRVDLKSLSHELQLSQNKIRKWFYDHSRKQLEENQFPHHDKSSINIVGRGLLQDLFVEIKENWKKIKEI